MVAVRVFVGVKVLVGVLVAVGVKVRVGVKVLVGVLVGVGEAPMAVTQLENCDVLLLAVLKLLSVAVPVTLEPTGTVTPGVKKEKGSLTPVVGKKSNAPIKVLPSPKPLPSQLGE